MTVHILKWAAGIESLDHLRQVHAERQAAFGMIFTRTRMVPRRADEMLDGGSVFWVIRRAICVRQQVLSIDTGTDDEGKGYCDIVLGPHVAVGGGSRRPFQGWRYLKPQDAPPDLATGTDGEPPPQDMAAELRALGLL